MAAIDLCMEIEMIDHMILWIIEQWNFDPIPDPFNKTCQLHSILTLSLKLQKLTLDTYQVA